MSALVIRIIIVDDLKVACCPLKRYSRSQAVGTETAKALQTLSWMSHRNLDQLRIHTSEGLDYSSYCVCYYATGCTTQLHPRGQQVKIVTDSMSRVSSESFATVD
jgi:hypothetical protein